MPEMLTTGKIKSKEVITEGLENAPEAIVKMLYGNDGKVGKPVVRVANLE